MGTSKNQVKWALLEVKTVSSLNKSARSIFEWGVVNIFERLDESCCDSKAQTLLTNTLIADP
jgi:hypothetical protein